MRLEYRRQRAAVFKYTSATTSHMCLSLQLDMVGCIRGVNASVVAYIAKNINC